MNAADEVADSLEASPEVLPFLPELLRDLDSLGCDLETCLCLAGETGLEAGARVLELACGKGALSVALAREKRFHVLGVDLFEPFVEAARERSEEEGIGDRCRFEKEDLRVTLDRERGRDLVIYASVGSLGRHDRCVKALRSSVSRGRYILIDDGYLTKSELASRSGYEHYGDRSATRERLTTWGDAIVDEVVIPTSRTREQNRQVTELIRRRAEELAQRHPESADVILGYVDRQEEECAALADGFVSAAWLLRRA